MIDSGHPLYIDFPNPQLADQDGLLAQGGNLNIHTLLSAYQQGIFPWFNENQPILWWSPDPRLILYTAEMYVSRSLNKTIRSKRFSITCGLAFKQVIEQCSQPRDPIHADSFEKNQPQTWITPSMKEAYIDLHDKGYAQSIECWKDNQLVGGLYGVTIAGMFFGESMFSKVSDSSKVSLYYLCKFLKKNGTTWLDCQVDSNHLSSLGAVNVSRNEFLHMIKKQQKSPNQLIWENFST